MKSPLELYDAGQTTSGYWRNYAFAAEPRSVWVQQVDTEVVCYSGGDPWLRFHNSYGEFFVLDGEGGLGGPGLERPWFDLHAFDVLQDGWGRSGLRRWLKGQPDQERRPPSRLDVRKRFRLGRGTLAGVELPKTADARGAFGYVSQGPLGEPSQRLEFCLAPRAKVELPDPTQRRARGTASLEGEVWEALEEFSFSYPNLSGTLNAASSYALLERTVP